MNILFLNCFKNENRPHFFWGLHENISGHKKGGSKASCSLSKKSKITFFALEKQLENGYSMLAHLDTFFLKRGFFTS